MFKRSIVALFFGDLLVSLVILFLSIQWLQAKIMFLHKSIHSSGSNMLLALWNFLKGFENVLPAFL